MENNEDVLKVIEERKNPLAAEMEFQETEVSTNSKTDKDYYVVVKMPNGMYFPFFDKFAPFDRMLRNVEGKENDNLEEITPLVITNCSNEWIPYAVKKGGIIKKVEFKDH